MNAEGLTAGGFYAHFNSKETLLCETFDLAFAQTTARILAGLSDCEGIEWLGEVVRRYLSRPHRDDVGEGCPLPALSAEVARSNARVRRRFQTFLEELVAEFEHKLSGSVGAPKDRAIAALALCVGGVILSRAVKDAELSDQILQACRRDAVRETLG